MTKYEVLARLAQQVVYLQGQFANTTAVVLPNYDEVKKFSKSLYNMLDELPAWLEVTTQYRSVRKCEWVSSKILFVHNPTHLKGYSIDCLYRSKRAITQADNQDLEYFNFLAAITQKKVIDFDD